MEALKLLLPSEDFELTYPVLYTTTKLGKKRLWACWLDKDDKPVFYSTDGEVGGKLKDASCRTFKGNTRRSAREQTEDWAQKKWIEKLDKSYKPDSKDIQGEIIYNHVAPPPEYIRLMNMQNNFYINLEKSILDEGVKNPILVVAGHENIIAKYKLPDKMQKNISKALVCNANGGSRLWIAQKYNMDIPCLISDFADCFLEFSAISEIPEIIKYYKYPPQEIGMNDDGLWIRNLPHIHLEGTTK